eukprot:PITA_23730
MGDEGKYSVTGLGTITFKREHGDPLNLKNVMYVPGLKKNLVFVSMLEDRGYDVIFSKGKVFLQHIATGQVKKIGILVKNLYQLEQISTGLPKGTLEQVDTCKGCTLGKYIESSFHDRDSQETYILDRFHSDVCGPFSIAFMAKHRYYVIFVDDYSRKCWIFFMQKKDQTFTKFFDFKALFEKESVKKVTSLWSDNGVVYVSNKFKNLCVMEGVKWELMAPHNPQHNGVAERKNKSIVGTAREMLHD